jgi:hypothetical protein
MKGAPCEVCGLPRGWSSRCRECGHDRNSAQSNARRARQASATTASQQTNQRRSSARPSSSSDSTTTSSRRESPGEPDQKDSRSTPRNRRAKWSGRPGGSSETGTGQPTSTSPQIYAWTAAPTVAGTVVSISVTSPIRGDRPWWVPLVECLAVMPGLAALMVLILLRAVSRSVRRARGGILGSIAQLSSLPGPHLSPSPELVIGVIEAVFKNRAAMRPEYSMIRLRVSSGEVACRYLAAPNILPVRRGDSLALWGSSKPDGIVRGYKLENRSNGTRHKATMVRGWVYLAAFVSAFLCLMVLSNVA